MNTNAPKSSKWQRHAQQIYQNIDLLINWLHFSSILHPQVALAIELLVAALDGGSMWPLESDTWSVFVGSEYLCGCSSPFPGGKKQSMSTLLREWDTDRVLLGTRPSWGGECSVVRTRHQPGRSPDLSNSSTVWPDWMLNSPTDPATKSCRTTVCSQPPDNYRERERYSF